MRGVGHNDRGGEDDRDRIEVLDHSGPRLPSTKRKILRASSPRSLPRSMNHGLELSGCKRTKHYGRTEVDSTIGSLARFTTKTTIIILVNYTYFCEF